MRGSQPTHKLPCWRSPIDNELANLVAAHGHDAKPTASFERVLQRAAIHVPSSGREEVTGANVLVAMFAERESHAAFFLQEQNMTRFDAVNYISQERPGVRKQAECGGVIPVPGLGRERWAENGVFAGPMAAPYKPPGRPGWGMWGPVHYLRGRLAFMKAEFEISDAQEQLWEAFAEALRDFLKGGGPDPTLEARREQPGCRNGWR
jgi:hypothetical protein